MAETDRELLEKAARAAGIVLRPMEFNNVDKPGDYKFIGYMTYVDQWPRGWFDPLTDHSDRYRLARDRKLMIDFATGEVFPPPEARAVTCQRFTPGDDKSEAYAILRAAAMGES